MWNQWIQHMPQPLTNYSINPVLFFKQIRTELAITQNVPRVSYVKHMALREEVL